MPNYPALKAKLADPQFAALIEVGNHVELASAFNATSGPNAGTVTLDQCNDTWFFGGMAAASLRISGLPDTAKQAKWRDVLQYLHLVKPPIQLKMGVAPAMLADAETDGVLLDTEVAALTTRQGSLAEVIGFFDFLYETPQTLTHNDIAIALKD